jgi:hypothetical protein
MKTKIKILLISALSLMTVLTASVANAGWNASTGQTCYGQDCRSWHNNGITHPQYPSGPNFASFNNYTDMRDHYSQVYNERQFLLFETEFASSFGFPLKTPWDSNRPSGSYNFNGGANYNINFVNDQPQRIGMWIYMHNNGVPDQYTANNTRVKLIPNKISGNSYRPTSTITAGNSKPASVISDVNLTGNQDFNLVPKELWVSREDGDEQMNAVGLNDLLSANGLLVGNLKNPNGVFASSELHYVAVYVEFEAVPQTPPLECRNLTITDPTQLPLINIDENGFNNENLGFTVEKDNGAVSGYRIRSNNGTITFNNNGADIQINEVNNVNQYNATMNGGPDNPNSNETVWVSALRANGTAWPDCIDYFTVQLEEEEAPVCEIFNTNPGSLGSQQVDVGFTTIELEGPTDNNGDPYRPNGQIPTIRYCYTNDNITFLPDSGNVVHPGGNLNCAVAPATDPMSIDTTQPGTMTIEVVGAEQECNDTFKTDFEYGGVCLNLEFVQDEFTNNRSEYCVTLDVESTVEGYNNHIIWEVERGNDTVLSEDTTNTLCIDLDYNFEPGDVLTARALDIDYEGNDCEDRLASEELICRSMKLDKNHFERSQDNEVCITDINPDDYPANEVEVSTDSGESETVSVDEDGCFVINEELLEDATRVDVFLADDCEASLTREVRPPSFSKNVKDRDGAAFARRAIANWTDEKVFYQITYEHRDDVDVDIDVTITDTIGTDGYIQGYIADVNDADLSNNEEGGRIYYEDDSMNVWVEGEGNISNCEDTSGDLCYYGEIGSTGGVTVTNVPPRKEVVVSYRGEIVDSAVNPSNCSRPDGLGDGICGEIYPNIAEFEDETPFSGRDKAEVVIPCPFFIIRSGGEVFMENPFDYGVDTLACSEIENVPSPFIVPDYTPPQTTPSTGEDLEGIALIKALDDRLCKSESAQEAGYGGVSRASSLICEVTLKTSEELTQYVISQNIQRNIDLFARYDKDLNNQPIVNGSNELPSNTSNVFVKDNGDLELSGTFSDGAQTIVVLNNDVVITGDITFKDPSDTTDPRAIPSLAVIVIGGNIRVQENVGETNGVFFVMENSDEEGGQMCEKDCNDDDALSRFNDKQYVHYGSIYGDIEHLFKYRTFAGDPTKLEAAVLIKFDSRIFLNTPPLLNELINVSQQVF